MEQLCATANAGAIIIETFSRCLNGGQVLALPREEGVKLHIWYWQSKLACAAKVCHQKCGRVLRLHFLLVGTSNAHRAHLPSPSSHGLFVAKQAKQKLVALSGRLSFYSPF